MTKIETISDNTKYKGGFFISFAAQPNLYWVKNNQAGTIMKLTNWFFPISRQAVANELSPTEANQKRCCVLAESCLKKVGFWNYMAVEIWGFWNILSN